MSRMGDLTPEFPYKELLDKFSPEAELPLELRTWNVEVDRNIFGGFGKIWCCCPGGEFALEHADGGLVDVIAIPLIVLEYSGIFWKFLEYSGTF